MDKGEWTQEVASGDVPPQRYGHAIVYHEVILNVAIYYSGT